MKTAQDVYDYMVEIEQAMWDKVESFRVDPFQMTFSDEEKDSASMAYAIKKMRELVKNHFKLTGAS